MAANAMFGIEGFPSALGASDFSYPLAGQGKSIPSYVRSASMLY